MAGTNSFSSASIIGTGISAGTSAFGSILTTKYNNAIAKAQASIARENAKTMELQAQYTLFAAESKVQQETMRAGQTKARQKVALAANGVAIGTGSAAQITASTDIIKTVNKNRIVTESHASAWGYRQKATDYNNQALMYDAQKQSAGLNFLTTALNGASKVAMMYAANQESMGKSESPSAPQVDGISSAQPNANGFYGLSGNYLGQGYGVKDNGTWMNPYGVNPLSIGRKVSILGY